MLVFLSVYNLISWIWDMIYFKEIHSLNIICYLEGVLLIISVNALQRFVCQMPFSTFFFLIEVIISLPKKIAGGINNFRSTKYVVGFLSLSLEKEGEGNGNPLQCSCLENPRDRGACWVAVYGVAQSRTRLKRLSSSSRERHFSLTFL